MSQNSQHEPYRKDFIDRLKKVLPILALELDLKKDQVARIVAQALCCLESGQMPARNQSPPSELDAFRQAYRGSMFFITKDIAQRAQDCVAMRKKLGLEPDALAFLAGLNPIVLLFFEARLIRPSDAALLEIQMTLHTAAALRGTRSKERFADLESLAQGIQDAHAGKFPPYKRTPEEWSLTKARIEATGEVWPTDPNGVLSFLG